MKVGILSDGKPGHLNQSLGIANILNQKDNFQVDVFFSNSKISD